MRYFFTGMVSKFAEDNGIKIPENVEDGKWNKMEYPHWTVYSYFMTNREVKLGDPEKYAKLIAQMSKEEVVKVTFDQLEEM